MTRGHVAMVFLWLCSWPGSLVWSAEIPKPAQDRATYVPQEIRAGKPAQRPWRVAILIYDGVFNTEFIAPLDVFQHAEARTRKVEVFTVAPHLGSVLTAERLKVIPHHTFSDAPNVDILVVPSGKNYEKDIHDVTLVSWIRQRAGKAKIVHANRWGAFLLGAAGILNGRWATTFPPDTGRLQKTFPRAIVQAEAKLVDDPGEQGQPRVITSAGGVVSYDAALYIVEDLLGHEVAESIARGLVFDRTTAKAPLIRKRGKP